MFLLSPLLFYLLIASDFPLSVKIWLGLAGVAFLLLVPLIVVLVYGGGSLTL